MLCPDVDVNAINEEGRTPLFLAAWNGNADIVEVIMDNEAADINKSDRMGWTPLQAASHRYRVLKTRGG